MVNNQSVWGRFCMWHSALNVQKGVHDTKVRTWNNNLHQCKLISLHSELYHGFSSILYHLPINSSKQIKALDMKYHSLQKSARLTSIWHTFYNRKIWLLQKRAVLNSTESFLKCFFFVVKFSMIQTFLIVLNEKEIS